MHTTLPTRFVGLLAAGLLALTACGGDDGDTGSSIPESGRSTRPTSTSRRR